MVCRKPYRNHLSLSAKKAHNPEFSKETSMSKNKVLKHNKLLVAIKDGPQNTERRQQLFLIDSLVPTLYLRLYIFRNIMDVNDNL